MSAFRFSIGDIVYVKDTDKVVQLSILESIATGNLSNRQSYVGRYYFIKDVTPFGYVLTRKDEDENDGHYIWAEDMVDDAKEVLYAFGDYSDCDECWNDINILIQTAIILMYHSFLKNLKNPQHIEDIPFYQGAIKSLESVYGKHNLVCDGLDI